MSIRNISITLLLIAASYLGGVRESYAQEVKVDKEWKSIRPIYRRDTLTIRFFGDIMMHSAQIEASSKGFTEYFAHLEDKIKEADISVANMEFTLAGKPYTGYPAFSAPDEYATFLAESGFDIFLCANNHILDKGSKGAERTLNIYKELNEKYEILYAGLAADKEELDTNFPLTVTRKGIRTTLINMTYGTNLGKTDHWPKIIYLGEKKLIEEAIRKSKPESDLIIALPHWGREYELTHSEEQERTSNWLIDNGVNAIIGCHPHVIQDTARINDVQVAYSLGNMVSNMSAPNTQLGLMITLKIVREEDGDISILPFELTHLWCSRPGGLSGSYTVVPVEEFIGKRDQWHGPWDYDKMITTYERVRKTHNNEH